MTVLEQLQAQQEQIAGGNWFQEIAYSPFKSTYWDNTKYGHFPYGAGAGHQIEQDLYGAFPDFRQGEWSRIDEAAEMGINNLNTELNLWNTTAQAMKSMQNEQNAAKRDTSLKMLQIKDDFDRKKTNLDKKILLDKAFSGLSEINALASQTNLGSGSNLQRRKLAEDSVKSKISGANLTRQFARGKTKRDKQNVVTDYDSKSELAQLSYDAQYGTRFQDTESKISMIGLDSMIDKINVYEEWETSVIDRVQKLMDLEWGYLPVGEEPPEPGPVKVEPEETGHYVWDENMEQQIWVPGGFESEEELPPEEQGLA